MKFVFFLLMAFVLTVVSGQKIKTSDTDSQKVEKPSTPVFDQLLISYLNIFQRKLARNSLTQNDEKVLEFLLRLIYMRQKEIDENSNDK
jgi:hypothetical protein